MKFLTAVTLSIFSSFIFGQNNFYENAPEVLEQKLRFSHLTIDEGLSQGFVSSIVQDGEGFMWFGTSDGLNRYDGYNFKVFRYNSFDTTSLSDNFVTALINDKSDRLWVGTNLGGLSCFNKKTESFFRFPYKREHANSIVGDYIYNIVEDRTSEFPVYWIITNSMILNQLVLLPKEAALSDKSATLFSKNENWIAGGYKVLHYSLNPADSLKMLSNDEIKSTRYNIPLGNNLGLDRNRRLWFGFTRRNIYSVQLKKSHSENNVYIPDKNTFKHIKINIPSRPDDKDDIASIFISKKGTVWAGTNVGLIKLTDDNANPLNPANNIYLWEPSARSKESTVSDFELVDKMAEDQQGRIWMATRKGIVSFSTSTKKFSFYNHDPRDPESPLANNFASVFVDAGNVVWCGSFGYGLSYVNPDREVFHHFNNPDYPNFSLYGLAEIDRNKILLQMSKRRFWLLFDMETKEINPAPFDFSKYEVFAAVTDKSGRLWFLAGTNLYVAAIGSGDRLHINNAQLVYPKRYGSSNLQTIYVDNKGSIWAAGPGEVINIDSQSNEIIRHYEIGSFFSQDELIKSVTKGMYRDSNNRLWIVSTNGLTMIDIISGKLKKIRSDENNKRGLSTNDILTIHPDPFQPDKILWLGTRGAGLNRFNTETEKADYFTIKDGLPNDVIYGLLGDENNNLWMSTNFGISCMQLIPDTLTNGEVVGVVNSFINYDKTDGLQGNEFNRDSYLKTVNGELIFGGLHGFNIFKPSDITKNTHVPKVCITGLQVNYKAVEYKGLDSILIKPITETTSVTLSYDQNTLTFEFASLDFSSVSKNKFSYILEGYDSYWSKPQTGRTATYTQIPPGKYKLRIKGSNNSGIWNLEGDYLEIIIVPPFWLTWWFTTLSVVFLLASAIIITRWVSTRKLKRKYEMLQRENEIKKKISRDLHDEIGSRVTQISLFSNLITEGANTEKRFKWGVESIREAASDIASALDEVVWTINPRNDNISSFAGYLVQYSVNYLDKADIKAIIDVPEVFPQIHLVSEKRHSILMVIKEALSNIVKHSGADEVRIHIAYESGELSLKLMDNGRGFTKDDVRLFGNGLKTMQSRIEEINGSFELESMPGTGTKIMVNVHLGE